MIYSIERVAVLRSKAVIHFRYFEVYVFKHSEALTEVNTLLLAK
jgi:hypothetical protein